MELMVRLELRVQMVILETLDLQVLLVSRDQLGKMVNQEPEPLDFKVSLVLVEK